MKTLTQFIKESNEKVSIIFNDLVVDFIPFDQHGQQKGIVFELPKNATRDTIQTYLTQCIVPYLPCGTKNKESEKYIGLNFDAITDINLTFDDVEKDPQNFHLLKKQIGAIKFDKSFGEEYTHNLEDVMLTGLKFTLSFSQFTLDNVNKDETETEDDCQGLLEDQFIDLCDLERTSKFAMRFQNVEFSDFSIEEQ